MMKVKVKCPERASEEAKEGGQLREPVPFCQGCANIPYCEDSIIEAELIGGFFDLAYPLDKFPEEYAQHIQKQFAKQRAEFVKVLEALDMMMENRVNEASVYLCGEAIKLQIQNYKEEVQSEKG